MPNVVIPALDPDFTTWYIPADLKDDSERRVKRWSGLHILIDQLNPRLIEALVRLACKSRQTASPDSLQIIRKAFSDTDDTTFPAAGNDREIEILSAATLGILLKRRLAECCACSPSSHHVIIWRQSEICPFNGFECACGKCNTAHRIESTTSRELSCSSNESGPRFHDSERSARSQQFGGCHPSISSC